MWLIGLDIEMIWNPPARPQDNGVVERSQGTGKRWAEPGACESAEELQKRLNDMDGIQREDYPVREGRSRRELYPQLEHSGRKYALAWEKKHWSLEKVHSHLASYVIRRRVDKTGQISLYNRNVYVGTLHVGQTVYLMFDPELCAWIIADQERRELRRKPADYLTRENIVKLKVLHRPPSMGKKS
jgi:hypothetical protein